MQTLDVISVNLWQMLISLANLLVMFFICKRFLYRPVRRILQQRQEEIDTRYAQAALAQKQAEADRAQWESQLGTARKQAQQILEEANRQGAQRRESLIREGKQTADALVQTAQEQAQRELEKAQEAVKQEIVTVSGALTEKLLQREVSTADHREWIDGFLDSLGDTDA